MEELNRAIKSQPRSLGGRPITLSPARSTLRVRAHRERQKQLDRTIHYMDTTNA